MFWSKTEILMTKKFLVKNRNFYDKKYFDKHQNFDEKNM